MTIARKRACALLIIRSTAIVLLVIGAVQLVEMLLNTFLYWDPAWQMWKRGLAKLASAISWLLPGFVLATLSRRLSRWVVPALNSECPNCGYEINSASTPRCPECGYRLEPPDADGKSR